MSEVALFVFGMLSAAGWAGCGCWAVRLVWQESGFLAFMVGVAMLSATLRVIGFAIEALA